MAGENHVIWRELKGQEAWASKAGGGDGGRVPRSRKISGGVRPEMIIF